MASVAVFGGSYSPLHDGHLNVARCVLDAGEAQEVWFVPCRRNPLKQESPAFDFEDRVRLINEGIAQTMQRYPHLQGRLRVDEVEKDLPEPSYTIDMLERLGQLYPSHTFRLLLGADSYLGFKKWKDWETLEKKYHPILFPRPGYAVEGLRPGWTYLGDAPQVDISSTEIREGKKNSDKTQKRFLIG